jgi:hypothetical protein
MTDKHPHVGRRGRVFPANQKTEAPKAPTPKAPAPKAPEAKPTEPKVHVGRRGRVFDQSGKQLSPNPKPLPKLPPKPVMKPVAKPAVKKVEKPAEPKLPKQEVTPGRKGRVFNLGQEVSQPKKPKPEAPKPQKLQKPKVEKHKPLEQKAPERKSAKKSTLSNEPVARVPSGRGPNQLYCFRYWRLTSNSKQKGNWSYHEIGLACEYPFVNNIALAEYGVTADTNSDNSGNNPAHYAIDGNLGTHWSTNVLRDHSQAWWSCDLQHAQTIRSIRLVIGPYWPGTSGLEIEGSNDGETWTHVKSITGMNPAQFDSILTFQVQ